MDFESFHHFLLLWNAAHQLSQVLWLHVCRVVLAPVHDILYLAVNIVKGFEKVHISKLHPLFISVTQLDILVFYFDVSFRIYTIFYVNSICLVEKIMDHGRHQVESSITDQKTGSWLLDSVLVLALVKFFKLLKENGCESSAKL